MYLRCTSSVIVVLTEHVPGNHGLGLDVDSGSVLVDCSDSEQVLCVLEQPGDVTGQTLALVVHDDPVEAVGVASLHDVVGDIVSAVLKRRLPAQRARLLRDLADFNTALAHSRGV